MNDEVLRRAKRLAADEGLTLGELIEQSVRARLSQRPSSRKFRFRWRTERGSVQPGVVLEDRDALFDLMDGRR